MNEVNNMFRDDICCRVKGDKLQVRRDQGCLSFEIINKLFREEFNKDWVFEVRIVRR